MADKTIADLTLKASPANTDVIEIDDGASFKATLGSIPLGGGSVKLSDATAAGTTLATAANAAAQRTALALGTAATNNTGDFDAAGSAAAAQAASQPLDADLTAIAGLASAADKGIQFTGAGTAATYDLTAAARTILDDATVDAMIDTLGGAAATGTGGLVRATSPTLVTPVLGVAAATSVNKVALTAPATGSTLTIAEGKTLTASASITLAGTDATTITFQGSDTYTGRATTDTLTNKRITKRVGTVASDATPTINTDNVDLFTITALAAAITSFTTNLSGTPTIGQSLIIRILDNGTARAITWGASFASRGATLPTTTVLSKYLYVGFLWNGVASTWDCVSVGQEV